MVDLFFAVLLPVCATPSTRLPMYSLLPEQQIASGLSHIHSQHIVHRDVKPANVPSFPDSDQIFIDGKRVLLGDFGLAKALDTPLETLVLPSLLVDDSSQVRR